MIQGKNSYRECVRPIEGNATEDAGGVAVAGSGMKNKMRRQAACLLAATSMLKHLEVSSDCKANSFCFSCSASHAHGRCSIVT